MAIPPNYTFTILVTSFTITLLHLSVYTVDQKKVIKFGKIFVLYPTLYFA